MNKPTAAALVRAARTYNRRAIEALKAADIAERMIAVSEEARDIKGWKATRAAELAEAANNRILKYCAMMDARKAQSA